MSFVKIDFGGRDYEGGSSTFNVSLSEASGSTVTVEYFTGSDTADSFDYYTKSGKITFSPGETTKTITINSGYDSLSEHDEFYFVELANPVGATFENGVTSRASAIVLDNDGAGSDLAIDVSDAYLLEGNKGLREAIFDVTLSQVPASDLKFSYQTFDITARAGSDYTPVSGTLTFLAGQDRAQVRVAIADDAQFEAAETFGLIVQPLGGLTIDTAGASGTGHIIDDDAGGLPTVSLESVGFNQEGENNDFIIRLSSPSSSPVSLSLRTVSGTASTSDYYTKALTDVIIDPGVTELRVSIGSQYDSIAEIDESYFLEVYGAKGAVLAGDGGVLRASSFVLDNDGGGLDLAVDVSAAPIIEGDYGSQDATFLLRLSRPQSTSVTFNYQTVDGTALAGQDYLTRSGSVTFAPGQDVAIVKVPVLGDLVREGAEAFSLNVSANVGGTTVSATGAQTILASDTSGRAYLLVDDTYYTGRYLDIRLSGLDPDDHYFRYGATEGRDPNAYFSTAGYLAANPDVKAAGLNPLSHYDAYGWREGRDAAANFDTQLYLKNNPDVKNAGIDPLSHYIASGQAEGRQAYAAVGKASDFTHGSFDAEYYLLANPDIAKAAISAGGDTFAFAYNHYSHYGYKEGRDPNAYFDVDGYKAAYADVRNAGIDPLLHYDLYGWKEGRDPSGAFDTDKYLAANADVSAAGLNPLLHYLQYGRLEGRAAFEDGVIA